MKAILLFLAAALWWPLHLAAQNSAFDEAGQALLRADYRRALKAYSAASADFRQANRPEHYALCRLRMAECYLALGDAPQAKRIVDEIDASGQHSLPDSLKALKANLMGDFHLRSGRNDLALEELLEAERMSEAGSAGQAKCFNDLGVVYWNNGNRELALQYHERALAIRKNAKGASAVLEADSYNNIGLIYLQDLPVYAVEYFEKAAEVYRKVLGPNHPKVATAYSNLAFALAPQGQHEKALGYLDEVMNIWNATYPGDHPNKAFTISNKGRISEMRGFYEEALVFQRLALQMYQRLYGDKHPEIANTYTLIGSVYKNQSEFSVAVEYFQKAIYANLYNQSYATVYDLPELRDYYNADILLSALQSKAKTLEALHFEKTLKLRDIDGSLATYVACDELITKIRQLRLSEADKLRLGSIAAEVYENGISTALYLSDRTFRKDHYRQLAFNFCERSKSAVLLDAINDTRAKHFAGIPDQQLAREDSLKDQVILLEQQLAAASAAEEERRLEESLFTVESALREFVTALEEQYPQYYQLKYDTRLATAESLQQLLPATTALLSYFVGADNLYVFLVSQKRLKAFTIKKEAAFSKNIVGLRNAIKYRQRDIFLTASSALYNQLIPRLPSGIRSLVVLPDGVIGTIQFESLVSTKAGTEPVRYLLHDYAISYDYSATLLAQRLTEKKSEASKGILLSAPLSFEGNDIFMPPLPGTELEVNEINSLFSGSGYDATLALSNSATEALAKSEELSRYRYLHFATHGMVDEVKPERSRIFLSPDDDDDGSLFAGEIYGLKINADLVNLSACETGLGKVTRGEGIIGLCRALMYAGAKNMVVSLWQVADASTSELMIEFYRQHLGHTGSGTFANDLRNAKLSLLQSEKYKYPYFWAPFILVGL